MYYRGRPFYPPEGHDWVPTDPIRRAADHNDALEEELYVHRLGAAREKFFHLLNSHKAFDGEHGWMIFADEDEGSVATLGYRQVLLISHMIGRVGMGEQDIPQVRLMTNEYIEAEGQDGYITEDITISPAGSVAYMMSAATSREDPTEQRRQLRQSLAPLFYAMDGRLYTSANTRRATPICSIREDAAALSAVRPYGIPDEPVDRWFALEQAETLLQAVSSQPPQSQYEY